MTVAEVRARYLAFFKSRGHTIIPSAPIVPGNDPTTLFTSSGMQPLLPYFLGKDHPEGKRVVNSQLSFRAGDIEEVGDNRHTTFFEMLGNWSFGDYFKQEQLPWIFEFLTSTETGFGIDPQNLYITVYAGDPTQGIPEDMEAIAIWKKLFSEKGIEAGYVSFGTEEAGYQRGMKEGERIFAYTDKNWWSRAGAPSKMPVGEPGGPDSEIFYDFGTPHDTKWGEHCHPNCDCGRFVEIGNSVFMQLVKTDTGFAELPKKNIDFGGGLERITMATVGPDIFRIDIFDAARKVLEGRSGAKYGEDEVLVRSFRIILDHMRASACMLAEGVTPSNTEAGYVLRRLIRRSIREADRLGITDAVLADVADGFGVAYQDHYPHILAAKEFIREELTKEEERFRKTLATGLRILSRELPSAEILKPGQTNYSVYEMDLVEVDGKKYADYTPTSLTGKWLFDFYQTFGFPFELAIEEIEKRSRTTLTEFDKNRLEAEFKLESRKHRDLSRAGGAQRFAGGLADHAEQTVRYHTTHHILLKALQMVLGPEVHQRGSNITSERLRIDFSSPGKMTDEQKAEVEKIVNDVIAKHLPVTRTVMAREEAEKLGAEMEFGVKYPDMVSVYSVGPEKATEADPKIAEAFSLEFCGGPHVTNTKEIGKGGKVFKIKKEEAVAAGVRRIKAVVE